MIIGATKTLEEMTPLSQSEIKELLVHGEGIMKDAVGQGVPLEVPAAMPIGSLVRLIQTVKRLNDIVERVANIEAGITEAEGKDEIEKRLDSLITDASVLLAIEAPKPQKIIHTPGAKLA